MEATTTRFRKTNKMKAEEERLGKPLEEILPETVNRMGSLEAAGTELDMPPSTIRIWLFQLGFIKKTEYVKPEN